MMAAFALMATVVMAGDGVAQTWDCGATPGTVTATLVDGTLTVSGSGAMADWTPGITPWYSDRTSITSVTIGNSVTYIGNYAFYGCT
jgi:hypothetical protein